MDPQTDSSPLPLEPEAKKQKFYSILESPDLLFGSLPRDLHPLLYFYWIGKFTGIPHITFFLIIYYYLAKPSLKKSYELKFTFGIHGKDLEGKLAHPRAAIPDPTGTQLFVADGDNNRIQAAPVLLLFPNTVGVHIRRCFCEILWRIW